MRKTINHLEIIVVSTIICLTLASCFEIGPPEFRYTTAPYLKVVNKHDLPITKVYIDFIDITSYNYSFTGNIPKGKSEIITLEPYHEPYRAEVTVYFGDMYSIKELKFNPGGTTTATLNVNGILE